MYEIVCMHPNALSKITTPKYDGNQPVREAV